jgi:LPXTG-motif cell wall-anchored protein
MAGSPQGLSGLFVLSGLLGTPQFPDAVCHDYQHGQARWPRQARKRRYLPQTGLGHGYGAGLAAAGLMLLIAGWLIASRARAPRG